MHGNMDVKNNSVKRVCVCVCVFSITLAVGFVAFKVFAD
jgi:hypothetical protein